MSPAPGIAVNSKETVASSIPSSTAVADIPFGENWTLYIAYKTFLPSAFCCSNQFVIVKALYLLLLGVSPITRC